MWPVRRDRRLKRELEEFIVAAIDDATSRITADVDKVLAPLPTAQGGGTTDTANAAALNAASDRIEAALSLARAPVVTGGTATSNPPAADAQPEGGALTAPA